MPNHSREDLPRPIIVGLSADLFLIVAEAVVTPAQAFLPITGNHVGQLGACLVLGIIVSEIKKIFS